MATRSSRKTSPVTDPESGCSPDESDMTDQVVAHEEAATASAPAPLSAEEKEALAAAKRKEYSKKRRDKIRAAQEAAGLILKREYRTADGAVFTNKKDAARHVATLAFQEYVTDNPFVPVIDGAPITVPADVLAHYIETHRAYLLSYLRSVNAV